MDTTNYTSVASSCRPLDHKQVIDRCLLHQFIYDIVPLCRIYICSPNILLIDENAYSAIHLWNIHVFFLPSLYIFKLLLNCSDSFRGIRLYSVVLNLWIFSYFDDGYYIYIYILRLSRNPKLFLESYPPSANTFLMECFWEKHHRPILLTSLHHKQILLLHSLILSSLYLCIRLQMYFDKSFPHPFFILPFV